MADEEAGDAEVEPFEAEGTPIDQSALVGPSGSRDPGPSPVINLGMAFSPNPTVEERLISRLTPAQIGKIVDQGGVQLANRHAEAMEGMRSAKQVAWAVLAAAFLICLAFLHYGKAELLKDIAIVLVSAGGGFMGGRAFPAKDKGVPAAPKS